MTVRHTPQEKAQLELGVAQREAARLEKAVARDKATLDATQEKYTAAQARLQHAQSDPRLNLAAPATDEDAETPEPVEPVEPVEPDVTVG